jgi:hypothetical protein
LFELFGKAFSVDPLLNELSDGLVVEVFGHDLEGDDFGLNAQIL